MILARSEIIHALKEGRVIVDPAPAEEDIDTTSIDLHVGDRLWVWKASPLKKNVPVIELDAFDYPEFAKANLTEVTPDADGCYVIQPHGVYLGVTHERVQFPGGSKLAGRVEGKSSLARLGLMVHMTAPLIHCGTGLGAITLEMYNHGPFPIRVTPGKSRICQLMFEQVSSAPEDRTGRTFPEEKDKQA